MRPTRRGWITVSRFRPSGRGKESRQDLAPSAGQLEQFADWLARHDLVRTGDSFFCLTSESRRRKGLDMCGAAKMTCCISPTGHVYPCAFLQEAPFLVGNVRSMDFQEIDVLAGGNMNPDDADAGERRLLARRDVPRAAQYVTGNHRARRRGGDNAEEPTA